MLNSSPVCFRQTLHVFQSTLVLGLVCQACGGGGDGGDSLITDRTPVQSPGFSPLDATDDQGNPASQLWWVYSINQGLPVTIESGTTTLSATYDDYEQVINPLDRQRVSRFSAAVSGSDFDGVTTTRISGRLDLSVEEQVQLAGTLAIESTHQVLDLSLSAGGQRVNIRTDVTGTTDMPLEWFLDRDDLDTLAPGFSVTQEATFEVTGTAFLSVDGESQTSPASDTQLMNETWTVLGQEQNVTIAGVTYDNVVQVRRDTMSIDAMTGLPAPVSVFYDVVSGVGFVRSSGDTAGLGQDLTAELLDTNLNGG